MKEPVTPRQRKQDLLRVILSYGLIAAGITGTYIAASSDLADQPALFLVVVISGFILVISGIISVYKAKKMVRKD